MDSKLKIRSLLLSLLALTCSFGGFAQEEVITNQLYPTDLADGKSYLLYDELSFDEEGQARNPIDFDFKEVRHVISLFTNPWLPAADQQYFKVDLKLELSDTKRPGQNVLSAFQLQISYDPEKGTSYRAKDSYKLEEKHLYTWLHVKEVRITDMQGNAIPTPDKPLFFVRHQLQMERYFQPLKFQQPVFASPGNNAGTLHIDQKANGNIAIHWKPLKWAVAYDLEWTYVDDYDINPGFSRSPEQVIYNFKNNSTRVRLSDHRYEIPNVFERGYVLFRVRGIGKWGDDFEETVEGNWSLLLFRWSIPGEAPHLFVKNDGNTAHERDLKNWLYIANFAEEGKRKDLITYLDGSLRDRQSITNLSTDQQVLVAEKIYDHQGRPAIEILPSPVRRPTVGEQAETFIESPAMRFHPNFNQNEQGMGYSRLDFDRNPLSVNQNTAAALGDESGAGNYYSDRNPEKNGRQAYVPDAGGYPFIHTEYMDDLTGRVRRQGGLGAQHQLSHPEQVGHFTEYNYGDPAQAELDVVFGNDVGYARHYKKQVMFDENGAGYVSYSDLKGNTIASAHAGEAPDNLEAITAPEETITIHLLEENNQRISGSNTLLSVKDVILTKASSLSFSYSLMPERFETQACPWPETACYDCVYDLRILVRDKKRGPIIWEINETIGNLDALRNCSPQVFSRNHTTAVLPRGTYYIEKSLTVNPASIERYLDDYFKDECILEFRDRIKDEEREKANENDCETPCRPCELTEVPQEPIVIKDEDGNTTSINIPLAIVAQLDGVCRTVCPENIPSPCVSARQLMLVDVSPQGQFGQVEDQDILKPESFKYSVYNENNKLPAVHANWRNPRLGGYWNPDGSEALIRVRSMAGRWEPAVQNGAVIPRLEDGTHWVRPQHLNKLEDFLANWQPSWAESLLAYHPEYCYLNWCDQQKESYNYDGLILSKQKLTDARAETDLSPLLDQDFGNDHIRDPFFSDHPNAVPILMDTLEHMLKDDKGIYGRDLNIVEAVKITISGMNRNFSNSDVAQYLSDHTLYSDPAKAEKEWQLYTQLYSFAKRKVQDKIRESYVKQLGCFSNDCPDSGLCGDLFVNGEKIKRFPTVAEMTEFCPPNEACGSPQQIAKRNETRFRWECGICPIGYDLLNLFNAFAVEEKLIQPMQLPSSPPLTFTDRMLDAFTQNPAAKYYQWVPQVDGRHLYISIKTIEDDQEVCLISLSKPPNTPNWSDFVQFNCFRPTAYVDPGESSADPNRFVMTGYDADRNQTMILGHATCINFTACDLPEFCLRTDLAEQLGVLMGQLFRNGNYNSPFPYTLLLGNYQPVFIGPDILQQFPNTDSLLYRQISRNGRSLKSVLYNSTSIGSPKRCTLDMFIVQQGFDYEDVARINGIRVPDEKPLGGGCSYNKMFLQAETANGQTFDIEIKAPCFSLADCCFSRGEAPAGQYPSCCIPFNKKILPDPPSCAEDNEELADRNTEIVFRDTVKRLRDLVRTAYIKQCLKAAESLQINYSDRIYHYTLFYYDQAGNLVKTIPPKGVRKLTPAELELTVNFRETVNSQEEEGSFIQPDHKMAATYRYNSLNQVVEKYTPDGGYTRYCYDELGRLILSQDAHQAQQGKCTFIRYDAYGRINITGKMNAPQFAFPKIMQQENYDQFFEAFGVTTSEIFLTYYDEPLTDENSNFPFPFFETTRLYPYFKKGAPQNLRNRLAALVYLEGSIADFYQRGKPYTHAIYYSYDRLGNVNELLQEYKQMQQDHPALAAAGHHIKKIEYEYDLISGNINQVTYQPGKEDQFIHWYTYDADNRLVSVKTGRNEWEDEVLKEVDATYTYYQHGPMARVELGHEKVQGLDYAYTIQGWLKGVNSGTLSPLRDIGKDGVNAIHPNIPKDVYGYVLSYFDEDYRPVAYASIGNSNSFEPVYTGNQALHNNFSKPLYNGGIRNITAAIAAFEDSPVQATAYSYDQLNRLKRMEVFRSDEMIASNSNSWRGGSFVPDYKSTFSYDANGNIISLTRNGPAGRPMDLLSYTYANPDANLLSHIDDTVDANAFDNDLDDQSRNNYYYDAKGRMKRDAAEGVSIMEWTNTDKLRRIVKNGHTIDFDYSVHGYRLSKMSGDSTTYYVRDLEGNIMSTYQIKDGAIRWEDVPLYGSKRLGSWRPGLVLGSSFETSVIRYKRGEKRYELSNHLGNVNTTISDRKYTLDNAYEADIQSAQDYYPFGMLTPGRNVRASGYRFGFQGMEMDQDVKGEGNSYSTEFRQYDARVGRWLSLDPLGDNFSNVSPLTAFNNNPVLLADHNGLLPVILTFGLEIEGNLPIFGTSLSQGFYISLETGEFGVYGSVFDRTVGGQILGASGTLNVGAYKHDSEKSAAEELKNIDVHYGASAGNGIVVGTDIAQDLNDPGLEGIVGSFGAGASLSPIQVKATVPTNPGASGASCVYCPEKNKKKAKKVESTHANNNGARSPAVMSPQSGNWVETKSILPPGSLKTQTQSNPPNWVETNAPRPKSKKVIPEFTGPIQEGVAPVQYPDGTVKMLPTRKQSGQ